MKYWIKKHIQNQWLNATVFILTNMKLGWGLDDLARLLCLNLQVCCADWGDYQTCIYSGALAEVIKKTKKILFKVITEAQIRKREETHTEPQDLYSDPAHCQLHPHAFWKDTWWNPASRGRCTLHTQWGHRNGGRQRKVKNRHQWLNPPQVPNCLAG